METGQISMMLMNVGTPTAGGTQPSSLATLPTKPGEQAGMLFAGLLEVMTPSKASQGALAPVSGGKGVPSPDKNDATVSTTAVQDGVSGLMAGLLNALDAAGKPLAAGTKQSAEEPEPANGSGSTPQDVVLNAVGPRMAMLTQIDGGRMPQAYGVVEQQQDAGADNTLQPATGGSAEVQAGSDTFGKKHQDVAMTAVGMQQLPLVAQADSGSMLQAYGVVGQQAISGAANPLQPATEGSAEVQAGSDMFGKKQDVAMTAVGMQQLPLAAQADGGRTPQADGTVVQQAVVSMVADASVGGGWPNPPESLLNPLTTMTGNGPLKGTSTDSTGAPELDGSNHDSQKLPDMTTLSAMTTRQVSTIAGQQNPAVVNSTASTAPGPEPNNQNGSVGSTVAPVSGTASPGKGGASSGIEVTAQSQQEVPLFRYVGITGQTQIDSWAQNAPQVAEVSAASTEKTTQTSLQQDVGLGNSGAMPAPATLFPTSLQQPGQQVTTSKSTLGATLPAQAALVPAAERDKGSNDAQGQVVLSPQDLAAAEIPAAPTAKAVQTQPQQYLQRAESGVMPSSVSPQEPGQAVPVNSQSLEGTGSAEAAFVPGAAKTGAEAGAGAVQTQPDSAATAKPIQSLTVDTAKFASAGSSGGESSPGEDKGTTDNFMNGQFHTALIHPQGNVEGAGATSSVSATVQNDAQQSGLPEQILHQVKDTLVNHDLKAGNDQIVLRLSPENLGELKVNLSMNGQGLKVEIVAENHMVRDALLQNTDSLKESLARQNIRMESFAVTTGDRGAGNPGQGQQQNDWRGLAQQRQQSAWMSSGGYRLPDTTTVASQLAYQTPSQHAMVDLHF